MEKLDPKISALLSDEKERNLSAAPSDEDIIVFVRYNGDHIPLETLGLVISYQDESVIGGKIALSQVEGLARHPNVVYIEKSEDVEFELNVSIPEVRANLVRTVNTNTNVWTGLTGDGVIIGILDSGVNYEHRSLRKPNGNTRIKWIWDKTLTAGTGESAPGAFPNVASPSGVEYSESDINNALGQEKPLDHVRHTDAWAGSSPVSRHGTHVIGIAAGNGLQDDRCTDPYKYVGVAPEADIIVVKIATALDIIEGLRYILHKAGSTPAVINHSGYVGHIGPHDGTTSFETTLDGILNGLVGKIYVKSSGNNADNKWHAKKTVQGNSTLELAFHVQAEDKETHIIDIWYPNAGRLNVSVKPEGDTYKGPVNAGAGNQNFSIYDGTGLSINSALNNPLNNDNQVLITLNPNGSGRQNRSGEWKIKLENTTADPVTVHCWMEGNKRSPYFDKDDADVFFTLSNPANAHNLITVGSYAVRGLFVKDELSDFSSRGPTRDSRSKPDITAPGETIVSSRGTQPGCCDKFWCWCCNIYHDSKEGTSMSAPHVTGTIALMLEKNDSLTLADVRNHLKNAARTDSETGDSPNANEWGAGKLDVKGTVDLVPESGGGGGGGGGGRSLDGPNAFVDAVPPSSDENNDQYRDVYPSRDQLGVLYEKLLQIPLGQKISSLGEQHADEIWNLVNHNKRVAVTWHRNGGKVAVQKAMNALAFPDRPIPAEIDSISTKERLEKIASAFYKYGSSRLKQDILEYAGYLFPLIGLSIHEGLDKLAAIGNRKYQFEPINL